MDIKRKAITGVKWTTISTIFLAGSQIIKISVLTRFLDKSDFGLVSIVMVVLGFTNLFVDMGLSSAILHKQNITNKELSSLYWINVIFSFLFFILLIVTSPFISNFYGMAELNTLIPLMSTTIIFSAIGRQYKVLEQKDLNFKFISIVDIITSTISLLVAVIMALYGLGVYSLVFSVIILQFLSNSIFLINGLRKKGLQLHFNFHETKPFLKIGIYQVGGQIINYFNRDLDILIIGKFFAPDILGGYSLAKQLVFRPAQILNPIISKVTTPTFAKLQSNINEIKNVYKKLLKIVSTLNFTLYIGMIIFAKIIVDILYGKSYEFIIIYVQLLSVYMFLRSIASISGSLVIALGRTDLDFYWNLISITVKPLVIILAAKFGLVYICWSFIFLMLAFYVPYWYMIAYKTTKISLKEYFLATLPNVFLLYKYIKSYR